MSTGYPNPAGPTLAQAGAKPPVLKWDVGLSAALLIVSAVGWIVAAGSELFVLAFTDYCPAETCDAHQASQSITIALSAAAALIGMGVVLAIIRIIRRRLAWPFAVAVLVLSIAAEVLGFVGYVAAVGYRA
jgi:hypothetical protein